MNKLTTEKFIKKAELLYGNRFDYSKVNFVNQKVPVEIICKIHGSFFQTSRNHFRQPGCKKCASFQTALKNVCSSENFIEKSKKIHGNKFSYLNTKYTHINNNVIITCLIHGDFSVKATNHLKGYGCKKCSDISGGLTRTKDQDVILKQLKKLYKNKYSYELYSYKGINKIATLVCKKHGEFKKSTKSLLKGVGCPKCHNYLTPNDILINKFKRKHGSFYDYSKVDYVKYKEKIEIICPLHGVFQQDVQNHLAGKGCKICGNDYNIFKKNSWIEKANGRQGVFYIIQCFNEMENFYKLGITFNSIKKRYNGKKNMPYNYKILKEIVSYDLGYIWELEKRFKKFKKNQHYIPKIYFCGSSTECFKP